MMSSRMTFRLLGLAMVAASCLAAAISAYDRKFFSVDLRVASGPEVNARCSRTFRVERVKPTDVLNLREQASADAPIRLGIPATARGLIDLGEQTGVWRRISFRGEVGYVNTAFLGDDIEVCEPKAKGTYLGV
jgi:hypothetical protein